MIASSFIFLLFTLFNIIIIIKYIIKFIHDMGRGVKREEILYFLSKDFKYES